MLSYLRKFSLFIFLIQLSFLAQAQNNVIPGTIRADATFHHISIHYTIDGDENLNSQLSLRYRPTGGSTFMPAAMTMRAHPGLIIDGNSTSRNFHAGSVMNVDPNSNYEIECNLTDPDGGSVVIVINVVTKAFPEVASSPSIKYVAPGSGGGSGTMASPYLGLQEAANNAIPGDHFIVTNGTYTPFILTTSGTAGNPISFLSQNLHGAIIDGGGTSTGIVSIGEFSNNTSQIILDGFILQNGRWGIDAQNTQFVTVKNNIIQDVDYGYVNRRDFGNEQDQYITNNLFIGNTTFPQSGIPGERGIDIRGNNNVVSYNTIKDFGDGVSTDGPPYEVSYSLDVYNNDIQNIVDDFIEVDGMISNSRVYANRCFNGRAGVSLAPVYGGPAYVFRNIFYNMENSAFKMNRGPSGMIIVNNTAVCDQNAVESPNGWQNTFYRNNLMLSTRYCFELFGLETGSDDDWDYGAFYSTRAGGSGTEWFKWNNVRYADVPTLQSSGILHANAIEVAPSDFEDISLPDPWPQEYDPDSQNFMPLASSSVINSGSNMDQLNDPFVTDGMPDRGALEFGEDVPRYGHLFDFDTDAHIIMTDDCIEIFPNPFTDKIVLDGDFSNFTIQILDSAGQLVSDHTGTSAPFEIFLASLPAGMYFVQVSSIIHNHLSIHKIIKE